jgi:signal peptidase I
VTSKEATEALPARQSSGREDNAQAAERASVFLEYAESILVTVILALFFTSFILQAYQIPTPSMEPTLLVGDHVLVNKFVFGGRDRWYEGVLPYRPIRRGDIIVFKFPFADHTNYVKRVIGLPGDRLRIVDQLVYINGKVLTEPYVVHSPGYAEPYGDNFPPSAGTRSYFPPGMVEKEWRQEILRNIRGEELLIPPHKYFAMGDNRDRSWDSRYWGFVDENAVMGRPMFIYWSLEAPAEGSAGPEGTGRAAGILDVLLHFPARTRWSRMFRPVH